MMSICVYCGSNIGATQQFKDTAVLLGRLIAEKNSRLVFGGGTKGLMGIISQSCIESSGYVLGVTTHFLKHKEGIKDNLSETRIVENMHERKRIMFQESDAFIILPGGLGTLDEAFEVLTWKQIGLHNKPIVILDVDEYWHDLFNTFISHMKLNGFVPQKKPPLFHYETCPLKAINYIIKATTQSNNL